MFSLFSGSSSSQPEKHEAKEDQVEEAKETKEEVTIEKQSDDWVPPSLSVEDVTCLINLISGCSMRGAFKIEEYEVILPVYQKLRLKVDEFPRLFKTRSYPRPEKEEKKIGEEEEEEEQNQDTLVFKEEKPSLPMLMIEDIPLNLFPPPSPLRKTKKNKKKKNKKK